jgi:hypothetical protein
MSDAVPVRSDRCGLDELFLACETGDAERAGLALGPGWTRLFDPSTVSTTRYRYRGTAIPTPWTATG